MVFHAAAPKCLHQVHHRKQGQLRVEGAQGLTGLPVGIRAKSQIVGGLLAQERLQAVALIFGLPFQRTGGLMVVEEEIEQPGQRTLQVAANRGRMLGKGHGITVELPGCHALPSRRWWCIHLSRRVRLGFRVLPYIRIGVGPLHIPQLLVRRDKQPDHRVIVARPVIVQPGGGVVVLPRKAFGGVRTHGSAAVAGCTIRVIELAGEQTGAAGRVAEDAQQRAEAIAEEEIGGLCTAADLQFTEQATGQKAVNLALHMPIAYVREDALAKVLASHLIENRGGDS